VATLPVSPRRSGYGLPAASGPPSGTPSCRCPPRQDLTMKTELEAVNGKKMRALEVFAHALRFFKQHAVRVGHPGTQLSPCRPPPPPQTEHGTPASRPAGAEGPVPVAARERCHPLGHHRARHLEAAGQAVHAGGCLRGGGGLLRAGGWGAPPSPR